MRKHIITTLIALLCLTFLIGCSPSKANEEASGISELLKYKGSYVGDNSAVGNILAKLEGGQFVARFALQTKEEPYGIEVTYGARDDAQQKAFQGFWANENLEKTFMKNATALFALIRNADYIKMTIESDEKKTLTVKREDVESYYGEDLRSFAENEAVWADKITKPAADTTDKLRTFFKEHVNMN